MYGPGAVASPAVLVVHGGRVAGSGFWGVRCGGLPGGGEPSALRWMAARAEFVGV